MLNALDEFYASKEEPLKSGLLALRSIILDTHPDMTETVKYGMPCFCYAGKPFCYLWQDKKTRAPYILMVDGKLLEHPALESGDRARMKHLPVNPEEDLPIDTINEVLTLGLTLRQS